MMRERQKSTWALCAPTIENLERRTLMSIAVNQAFWSDFGGNAQHTGISPAAAQTLQSIHWQTPVDLHPQIDSGELATHYGSPIITAKNTVLVPVKTGLNGGFDIVAIDGASGNIKWTFASDYTPPPGFNLPAFSPAMTSTGRLYVPGAGGTVYYLDHLDGNSPPVAHQLAFYGNAAYLANPGPYDVNVYIATPLTISQSGVVYFGFQTFGDTPSHLQSGIARISAVDHGISRMAIHASGDPTDGSVALDSAPALSNDGKKLYIVVNPTSTIGTAGILGAGSYLLCLDAASLLTISKVKLLDPVSGMPAVVPDDGSASPTVGPDGDVYFGVLDTPFTENNARGWLLHFNSTLTVQKTTGQFGWDDTVSIVPASMVKSYHGKSSYLILTKYNNYAGYGSGNGINEMAVLDPNATQTDAANGATVMKEVETIAGVTPDDDSTATFPGAVKEWCVNTVAIDPATDSALVNSEDGKLYRWNLSTNKLTQAVRLTAGLTEAYTPTAIGPDGTVYAMQDGILFAVGAKG